MNYEIKVKGLDELVKKLGVATAQETIEQPLFQGALDLATWSKVNRLSGRPGLKAPTGRLRSSIAVSRSIKRGEFEFRIGTNVEYARIHEFGGTIHRYPRSSLLAPKRYVRGPKKGAFKSFSRGRGFTFGAYDINIPARPFLRPSIENQENRQSIVNKVSKAISEALAK